MYHKLVLVSGGKLKFIYYLFVLSENSVKITGNNNKYNIIFTVNTNAVNRISALGGV